MLSNWNPQTADLFGQHFFQFVPGRLARPFLDEVHQHDVGFQINRQGFAKRTSAARLGQCVDASNPLLGDLRVA